jgi:Tfp pilus assembly protein PilV
MNQTRLVPRSRRGQKGLTLVEVLIAFFLLFVVSLAVLEVLSLSVAMNGGAAARSNMLAKAEQVFEVIRVVNYARVSGTATMTSSLIPNPLAATSSPVQIPNDPNDAFWGRPGVNVIEPNAKYRLSFSIATGGNPPAGFPYAVVTVTATPILTGTSQFLGMAIQKKAVRYVGQINL